MEDLAYALANSLDKLNDTLTRIADALNCDEEGDIIDSLRRIAEAIEKGDAKQSTP
jgi:hypothetical protein